MLPKAIHEFHLFEGTKIDVSFNLIFQVPLQAVFFFSAFSIWSSYFHQGGSHGILHQRFLKTRETWTLFQRHILIQPGRQTPDAGTAERELASPLSLGSTSRLPPNTVSPSFACTPSASRFQGIFCKPVYCSFCKEKGRTGCAGTFGAWSEPKWNLHGNYVFLNEVSRRQ